MRIMRVEGRSYAWCLPWLPPGRRPEASGASAWDVGVPAESDAGGARD